MASKCAYKYNEKCPIVKVEGWHENAKGLLEYGVKEIRGLQVFGANGGILTEDALTDAIVDFLMSKTEPDDKTKMYEQYLVKVKDAPAK